jgi:hypothetical protein
VRTYLVTKGVKFQQVVAQGYGSSVPLTPDTSPRGRAANRRVEIRPGGGSGPLICRVAGIRGDVSLPRSGNSHFRATCRDRSPAVFCSFSCTLHR